MKATKKKHKQTKDVEPIVTKIPKKKIQKSSKKYHPFTNQKANLRCSPGNLTEFLEGLTPAQKKVVKEMGFGDILFINIHTIPTGFAYWLLQNYEPNTHKIFDGTHEITVSSSLINDIFGIPNGGKFVVTKFRPNSKNEVVNEWRSQFGEPIPAKITMKKFSDHLKKKKRLWKYLPIEFFGDVFFSNG
ncbi:hypothetical protein Hanom_Chr16g01477501 [Helianthus anomalus]